MEQKWICNKCGFEMNEPPKHKNQTCQQCKKGRFRVYTRCECGKWFHSDKVSRKYCSKDCSLKFKKYGGKKGKKYPSCQRARIAVCPVCGQSFRAIKDTKKRKAVYCSKECWNKRSTIEKTCPECGKSFSSFVSLNKKYCSRQCRNNAYRKNTGELSHFWKGGKTKEAELMRSSAEYKSWRNAVFKRDNYICQCCGAKGRTIEAHHIKERCRFPELIFDVNNGLTLCHECHKKTDNYGRKASSYNG